MSLRPTVIPALSAVLFMVSIGMALGASDITGPIKSIDAKKHTVTLGNDESFVIDSKVDLSKFKVGQRVKITFTHRDAVISIEPAR